MIRRNGIMFRCNISISVKFDTFLPAAWENWLIWLWLCAWFFICVEVCSCCCCCCYRRHRCDYFFRTKLFFDSIAKYFACSLSSQLMWTEKGVQQQPQPHKHPAEKTQSRLSIQRKRKVTFTQLFLFCLTLTFSDQQKDFIDFSLFFTHSI